MNKDNMLKAIFSDADDTIIDHKECEKQALIYMFHKIEKDYKEEYQDVFRPLDRSLWDSLAHNNSPVPKEEIPQYRFQEFFKQINLEYQDYKKANELFQEGLANSSALIETAGEVVKYLYNKGYKLYIVTNGLVRLQKPRIINSEIANFISYIIVSEEVGASKPDPKIFNTLLDRIKLRCDEVIMIGDSLEKDIKGAKNANIKAIWYNSTYQVNSTDIVPNYEIKSLRELEDIL